MILTTQTDYIGRTHGDLAAVEILADWEHKGESLLAPED